MTNAVAKDTFGSELWAVASAGTLVKLGDVFNISQPSLDRGMQDATSHDSAGGAEEVIPEMVYKVGPFAFQGHYVPNGTLDTTLSGFMTAATKIDFKIVNKGTSALQKASGSGYVSKYSPDDLPLKGKQTFSCEITVTGAITKAANT